ncbi:MAG TPA: hypothetical protein VFU49_11970 [Ktedonobacteraceae bacterium]|nr:hypothetical protein [Ktedonobacteraceae bacterium]
MQFLVRLKSKYLIASTSIVAILCMLITGSLFVSTPQTQAATLSHSHATVYHSVTKGTIAPAGIADPRHPPQAAATQAAVKKTVDKGQRLMPRATSQAQTASSQIHAFDSERQAGKILRNFNGVSSLDSEVTNFGAEFEPPDQGLCVGNGFVLEPVNSAFTIYRTNGSVVLGPLNVNVLFNDGLKQFTSDPRCFFDKTTNTWIAIILFISDDNTQGRTDIAINRSGDPTTPWTVYHLDATDDGSNGMPSHAGCPCFGDQPLLGIDSQNVYINTNEFSILGPQANGAQVYALSKSQLFSLKQNVHFVHFDNINIGGAVATSIQPAFTYGHADAGFFLNSLDPNGTSDNRLGVWALTNRDEVSEGGVPTLSSMVIASETYAVPPPAIQKGTTQILDSGDDRLQEVQFINGDLFGALDTSVNIVNDTAPRAGIAWFQVHPSVDDGLISDSRLVNQGYLASLGNYLLYPSIQVSFDHTAVIVFTFSGPNNFPSAAYSFKHEDSARFSNVRIAADGTGFYNEDNQPRWGDYSWATLDPNSSTFWLAIEYVPPVSSQTTDGVFNWGTRVFRVNGDE